MEKIEKPASISRRFLPVILLCLFLLPLSSQVIAYTCPAYVEVSTWNSLKPHFLPEDHPAKARLDQIFTSARVSLNSHTLAAAGFETPQSRPYSQTIVTRHPALPNYLLKLFTDDQNKDDAACFLRRIKGMLLIKRTIAAFGYQKYFKVPKKWIYPLPEHPSPSPECVRKNFILLVEDVKILEHGYNHHQWKEAAMTPRRLEALYVLVQTLGLDDSIYAFNVPFCKDGKLAFIDTERYHRWPVNFEALNPFLSNKMKGYWEKLIIQGGP